MNRDEFESKLLEVWMKSLVPLTLANLQYFAKVPRRTLTSWLDDLQRAGVVDLSLEDRAELEYIVPGAGRPADGPTTCEEYERKRQLVEEAKKRILAKRSGPGSEQSQPKSGDGDDSSSPHRRRKVKGRQADPDDEDSDFGDAVASVASTVGKMAAIAGSRAMVAMDKPLSALDKPRGKGDKSLLVSGGVSLLGPVGWLYAGSFREAVPATAAFLLVGSILPSFLFAPLMTLGMLASSAVGLTYAWQYNRKHKRTPLLLKGKHSSKTSDD